MKTTEAGTVAGLRLPSRIQLDTRHVGGDMYAVDYRETFESSGILALATTVDALRDRFAAMGFQVRTSNKGCTVILRGTVSRATLAGAMVGEFLFHSPIAGVTLGELLLATVR